MSDDAGMSISVRLRANSAPESLTETSPPSEIITESFSCDDSMCLVSCDDPKCLVQIVVNAESEGSKSLLCSDDFSHKKEYFVDSDISSDFEYKNDGLKSGWSVHTQEPSQSKKSEKTLTENEQEHIRQVIARAQAIDHQEQHRIGKLVERLDNMKRGKVGNGTTQCMLCGAEFGLFGPRSYAAMCTDCQKYVCQKNCGVETFDSRHDVVFLCKICSEYREMWKKTGAWFYQGVPKHVYPPEPERPRYSQRNRPQTDGIQNGSRSGGSGGWIRTRPGRRFSDDDSLDEGERYSSGNDNAGYSGAVYRSKREYETDSYDRLQPYYPRPSSRKEEDVRSRSGSYRRKLPQPPIESMGHTSPRRSQKSPAGPVLKPRWALEHMGRSDSYPERQEEETSSDEEMRIKKNKPRPEPPSRTHPQHMERISCGRQRRITDESDSPDPDTRSPTPPSSPRGSWVATPSSSHGGEADQTSETGKPIGGGDVSDSKSIDSGVVQSDNSQSRPSSFQTGNPTPYIPNSSSYQLHYQEKPRASVSVSAHSRLNEECDFGAASAGGIKSEDQQADPIEPKLAPPELMASPPQRISSHSQLTSNFHRQLSLQQVTETQKKLGQLDSSPEILSSPDDDSKKSGKATGHRRRSQSIASVVRGFGRSLSIKRFRSYRHRSKSPLPRLDSVVSPDSLGTLEYSLLYDDVNQTLAVNLLCAKSTKLRSKTIPKTLNPTWEQKLMYYGVTEDDRMRKSLLLTVLDEDRFGADFLGETRFPLKKLSANKERHFNVYLEKQLPIERGPDPETERGKILLGLLYNAQQQHLVVHVVRCAELLGLDASGYSDPYIKLSLKPETSKKHHAKSKVKKKTCNPEYNEEFSFPVPLSDLQKKSLEVAVWDKDVGKHDDFIGGIHLSATVKGEKHRHWMSCLQNPGQKVQKWHKLLPPEAKT